MEPVAVSKQASCDYLDQMLKSNVSEIIPANRTLDTGTGAGERKGVCLFHWGEWRLRKNFLMPFKK